MRGTTIERWAVGDRAEVQYDVPGGWTWTAATVREVGSDGSVRVVFDTPTPTQHPSWWASPQNVRRPSVPDVASAMARLTDAVTTFGPYGVAQVTSAWNDAVVEGTREAHRRLYDAVLGVNRAQWAPPVAAAMDAATEALRAIGDACESAVHWHNGDVAWHQGIVTRINETGVYGRYTDSLGGSTGWGWDHGTAARGLRRPLTKPSADQTPAPAETLADATAERDVTPHNLSRWNATCRCGSPSYEGFHARECSLGSSCPVVAGEPEPDEVWLSRPNRKRERLWAAAGGNNIVVHPTRDGAVALWRERARNGGA